jgi:hypothetical protein
MPSRMLCNDVQREGTKHSPDLASRLFCYVPLHKIWYGIVLRLGEEIRNYGNGEVFTCHTFCMEIKL